MAGGKQTPRQKLIGLMYLIFLAMMALNVSVNVLDSFPMINRSIEDTNRNFESKLEMEYGSFEELMAVEGPGVVNPYFDQAMHVGELADSLVSYIRNNRTRMLAMLNNLSFAEAEELDLMDSGQKDNYSRSTRFWLEENVNYPGYRSNNRASVLKELIANFKHQIDSILETHDQTIQHTLDVDGPFSRGDVQLGWEQYTFERVISVAVATDLNRLITEVRNAEFDAVSLLYDLIHADDFRFDQITARVVPESRIVMSGGHFEADVFVAAIDTRRDPEVRVDGIGRIPVSDGVGRIRIPAREQGVRNIRGEITMITPAGARQAYPFQTQFRVQQPVATVSADAMNVLYAGVPNPVSISVPGVASDQISATSSVGRLIRQPDGRFEFFSQTADTDQVRIRVEAEGQVMAEGIEFRLRPLPRPIATIDGRLEHSMSAVAIEAAGGLTAEMGEQFDFDFEPEIISFEMYTLERGDPVRASSSSARFTTEMLTITRRLPRNTDVQFRSIQIRTPDGEVHSVGGINVTMI